MALKVLLAMGYFNKAARRRPGVLPGKIRV